MGTDDRLARIEDQMNAILRRLGRLETRPAGPVAGASPGVGLPDLGSPDLGSVDEDEIAFSGSIRRGKQRFRAQVRVGLSEVLAAEPEAVARVFAALGNPFRVRLIRALLDRPRTSQELQVELDVGAAGQLYHHLKELLAARLIVQQKRGLYAIRHETVMPICLAFLIAPRLAAEQEPTPRDHDEGVDQE